MDLNYWKDKYRVAKSEYADVLERLNLYEGYIEGTHLVAKSPNSTSAPVKKSLLVRNLIHELVEAQIDSTIPAPKVNALKPEDVEIAQKSEHKLRNENDRMHMISVNDMAERFVYEYGGCVYHIEWDNSLKTHTTMGEVVVSELHPKQLIPQPGVYEIQRMDYLFLELAQTKEYIKAVYHVDVSDEGEEVPEARVPKTDSSQEELVTHIICYFRNDSGGIGRISWVNDVLIESFKDYHARRLKVCKKCGASVMGDVCECGNKAFSDKEMMYETFDEPFVVRDDVVIPAGTRIPYYKPSLFPVVVRKNISKFGSLLGLSDIDVILDQQDSLKKLESNIMEKLLKGGSFLSLPKGAKIKLDGEQYNVIELDSPADKSMIDVYTIQADISADLAFAREIMEEAKGLLGVTDSFLGRKDSTATSGRAKQLSVQQSAGRLESKRIMKSAAYAEIYELVLKFLVAFSDEPRPIVHKDMDGQDVYSVFSRYDFLERDSSGEWFYNVDFLFSTDVSGDLASNRAAMWEETRLNFQQGAFGDPTNPETQILFWQFMEEQHYPNAGRMKDVIEARLGLQNEMAAIKQQNDILNMQVADLNGKLAAAEEINSVEEQKQIERSAALLNELETMQSASANEVPVGNASGMPSIPETSSQVPVNPED